MAEAQVIDAATPGLDSLGGMVAGIDAEAAAALDPSSQVPPGQPGAAPQGPDYLRGASGIVDMARAMIGGFAPGAEWDEATSGRMAASLAPVFEKYGLDMETAMPCELVALVVCGPVLYQSARGIAHKIKMDRLALADARPGVNDPNTVRGAHAVSPAANVAPAPDNVPDLQAAERLAASVRAANVFPDM
jgi:nucleoside diphosphate kinase